VTAKYDYSARSDPLYIEIIHMVENSHNTLFDFI